MSSQRLKNQLSKNPSRHNLLAKQRQRYGNNLGLVRGGGIIYRTYNHIKSMCIILALMLALAIHLIGVEREKLIYQETGKFSMGIGCSLQSMKYASPRQYYDGYQK